MGYIAPVTNFTAMNYHARQIGDGISPHYIEKPFKVILKESTDEEAREQEAYEGVHKSDEKYEREAHELMAFQIVTMNHSQLTGKGGLFHDRV